MSELQKKMMARTLYISQFDALQNVHLHKANTNANLEHLLVSEYLNILLNFSRTLFAFNHFSYLV